MTNRSVTNVVYKAIAQDLIKFGYSGVTVRQVREIHEAYKFGAREEKLPHGVIGMMAQKHIEIAVECGLLEGANP